MVERGKEITPFNTEISAIMGGTAMFGFCVSRAFVAPQDFQPYFAGRRRRLLMVAKMRLTHREKLFFQSVAYFFQQHLGACGDGRFCRGGCRGAFDLVDDFHQSENTRRDDEKFDNLVDE